MSLPQRNRPAEDERPVEAALKCPNCGGNVRHEVERLSGYGQTIEQCEHALKCGYFRTLEKIRRPALVRAPSAPERTKVRSPRPSGPRTSMRESLQRVLGTLPRSGVSAMIADEVAAHLGFTQLYTKKLLDQLCDEGKARREYRRTGRGGRQPYQYRRAA